MEFDRVRLRRVIDELREAMQTYESKGGDSLHTTFVTLLASNIELLFALANNFDERLSRIEQHLKDQSDGR
jgi:hypothetical protein